MTKNEITGGMIPQLENSNKNRNICTDIWLIDTKTDQSIRYDTKALCAVALGVRTNVIDVYLDKDRLYKGRYIIRRGEVHQKKIPLPMCIDYELMKDLRVIINQVEFSNIVKLTNAICRDFIFRYDNNL